MSTLLPKKFFLVSGSGLSKISRLNAFDRALVDARIDQCNLVPVSSILPRDAMPVDYTYINPGTITFCVLSRIDNESVKSIGTGIGWAMCEGIKIKERFGIVAEDSGHKTDKELDDDIKKKLWEMAEARNMKIIEHKIITKCLNVPKNQFGSVIAALIFLD